MESFSQVLRPTNRVPFLTALLLMSSIPSHVHFELRENIEYAQAGDTSLQLDARIPEGNGPFAAAIIVHGGAWVAGDRRNSVLPLFQPLADAHIASFSISYRLAARGNIAQFLTLGSSIDDVRQAVAFVKAHAAEYHVDRNRVVLIGESAGAQLASMAALRPWPNGTVRGVVAFYNPSDLVKLVQTSSWIPDNIRQSLKGSPLETLLFAGLREFSPVTWVNQDTAPFLLIHGTEDPVVPFEQSQEFCDNLHAAGGHCELYAVKGGHHGIRWWDAVGLTDYKSVMIRWLSARLS
jgi:acetyl esterase/lipase